MNISASAEKGEKKMKESEMNNITKNPAFMSKGEEEVIRIVSSRKNILIIHSAFPVTRKSSLQMYRLGVKKVLK
ncbi:hypothetical protein IPN35_04065 [Candidatus Peregrinibacteria bacterium]|nr:MAG: hypothetical protein IPN35_04065 [Candidatus Peregrinibacteria bacterium]